MVVLLAFASLAVLLPAGSDVGDPWAVATLLVFNGVVLAGAHFYLAWRGEDGLVPVAARWRFVATVAVIVLLGGVVALTEPATVASVRTDVVLTVLAGGIAVGYLAVEARDGYRESTADP